MNDDESHITWLLWVAALLLIIWCCQLSSRINTLERIVGEAAIQAAEDAASWEDQVRLETRE